MSDTQAPAARPGRSENIFVSLLINVAAPTLILMKLSASERLGPVWGLVVALAFPLGYGIWDFATRRNWNAFSAIGFISILLTGGLGLMKAGLMWFAVKEAAVPSIFGLAVLFSLRTRTPLVRTMLYNDKVINVAKVDAALGERNARPAFDRLLSNANLLLAGSFFLSAALNFTLARVILKSPAGTSEFNSELGKMNALSWPVIVIPSMVVTMLALWYLLSGVKRLTGLDLEAVFHPPEKKKAEGQKG